MTRRNDAPTLGRDTTMSRSDLRSWAKEEYADALLTFHKEWLASNPDSTADEREALRRQLKLLFRALRFTLVT